MYDTRISDAIRYIGADDVTLDLFESQYTVPDGVSYNSYVILDEKVAVLDTVDARATDTWLENLETALNGRKPDYLVMHHLEPDHAGSIGLLIDRYPDMVLVASAKAMAMLPKYYPGDYSGRSISVKEGDTLCLGQHTLTFIMAPMVHWPEVMVSYESTEKILFTADAFGTFGALCNDVPWEKHAARYYYNIVGKYGVQVQALLKKAAKLDIRTICALHGPILREDLGFYLGKYDAWSRYVPESDNVVVAYASIHGNTARAAARMAEILESMGAKVSSFDLCREDQSFAVAEAFRCKRMVCMSATYDGGLFPAMEHFLAHLRDKTFRSRTVALVENGSWAPSAAKHMRAAFEAMKDITVCDTSYTIQGALKPGDDDGLKAIAQELLEK